MDNGLWTIDHVLSTNLPHRSPSILYIILKNVFAEAVKGTVECFPAIDFGELTDKLLEVGIFGNHERGNWDI